MAKWEQRPVLVNGTYVEPIPVAEGGHGGMPFHEFPKMLYRGESADGGPRIAGMLVVRDEAEQGVQLGRGWSLSQAEAVAAVEAQQLEFARLAANRVHNDRLMSAKALEESQAYDETKVAHVPAIPDTPIKRRVKKETV